MKEPAAVRSNFFFIDINIFMDDVNYFKWVLYICLSHIIRKNILKIFIFKDTPVQKFLIYCGFICRKGFTEITAFLLHRFIYYNVIN